MKTTTRLAVRRLLFGSTAANRRRLAAALIAIGLLVIPGVMLGALITERLWSQRRTPASSRWGWSVVAAATVAFVAPMVVWTWPGQLLSGGISFGSVIGSGIVEAMMAPLTVQVITWLRQSPAPAAPTRQGAPPVGPTAASHASQQPAPTPASPLIHLGIDQVGRPADLDLGGEASALVVGLPGTGKTTTLVRLASESLRLGWSVVVVDLKGSGLMNRSIHALAERHAVPLYLVDRSEPDTFGYDPCSGDPAQIANKLIGSFSFAGVANVYQQVALDAVSQIAAALQARDGTVTLEKIVEALQPDEMTKLGRAASQAVPKDTNDPIDHMARMAALSKSAKETRVIMEGHIGIQKRLASLNNGTFRVLLRRKPALAWETVMATPSLTYMSLPTLASPTDVELLGRVVIQDVKQVAEHRLRSVAERPRCLVIVDEFAALNEPEQIVDLILQGREASITVIASTQFLPKTPAILHAMLGAGVVVAHRVAGPDADVLAGQFGTTSTVEVTPNIDYTTGDVTRGTVRRGQTYTISPGQLRDLEPGHVALRVVQWPLPLRHRLVSVYREEI